FTKGRLLDIRSSVALLTNAALAREGFALAVSHQSLEDQGLSRDPARYGSAHDTADLQRTLDYRQQLAASGVKAFERWAVCGAWKQQARGLPSPDRQYTLDLARDHVWRFDHSPARVLERQESQARTAALLRGERAPSHRLVRPPDSSP